MWIGFSIFNSRLLLWWCINVSLAHSYCKRWFIHFCSCLTFGKKKKKSCVAEVLTESRPTEVCSSWKSECFSLEFRFTENPYNGALKTILPFYLISSVSIVLLSSSIQYDEFKRFHLVRYNLLACMAWIVSTAMGQKQIKQPQLTVGYSRHRQAHSTAWKSFLVFEGPLRP